MLGCQADPPFRCAYSWVSHASWNANIRTRVTSATLTWLLLHIQVSSSKETIVTFPLANNDLEFKALIHTKLTARAPDSLDFSLLKAWVDTCSKSHKQCNEKTENWYPTRLLHITTNCQQVRLVISRSHVPQGRYMTLSHRWGENKYINLQTSTIAQLQRAVVVDDLPPAFQDAIKIAAFLDIRYLWIDALCIKQDQDDRSDWETESLSMGKVYANAFLNVSATLAVDGKESLFHSQGCGPIEPSEVKLKVNGKISPFYAFNGEIWENEIPQAQLNNRGWVFQERFLARRVLHFSTTQLGWECRQLTALEVFPKGLPSALGSQLAKSSLHNQLVKASRSTRRSSVADWRTAWIAIVEEYSHCALSFPNDKLIAFSGIGASISEFIGTEHVAGMLSKSLIYDLAWWRWEEDKERFPLSTTFLRAPSWSWTSVDGQVNLPQDLSGVRYTRKLIESIEIICDHDDPLGKHSRLRLQGLCMPVRIKWTEDSITTFTLSELSACSFTVDGGSLDPYICFEIAEEEARDLARRGHVLLLPLFMSAYFFHGILICSTRGKALHRRIGAVEIPVQVQQVANDAKEMHEEQKEQRRKIPKFTDKDFRTICNNKILRLVHYIQRSSPQVIMIS